MPARQNRRQRLAAIGRFGDQIPLRHGQSFRLQARGLFMLADVKSVITQHTRRFAKHRANIRNVTSADRLHDNFKRTGRKHRQIIHRSLNRQNLETVFLGDFTILIEHRIAQIDNRNHRARCRQKRALQSAARSQAQNPSSAHVAAQPIFRIKNRQWILQVPRENRACMSILPANALVPRALVVFEVAPHVSILPCNTCTAMKCASPLRKPTMKTLTMKSPNPFVCSGRIFTATP